ncbi:MAG: signal peptidase II [Candidatus Baltobacteraceae bacterium]
MLRSLYFWLAFIGTLALDQYTKRLVIDSFIPGESRIVIPHALWLTYVQNRNGAFGLFGSEAWFLVGMALVVLAVFWYAFRDLAARSRLVRLAFGAIAGGALGNIVDRFHYSFVVDFLDLRWWPVFNVADSCISVGVVLLVIATLTRERAVANAKS